MELQTLLTADYLDIIFDKRNKNYGSYELRKHYNQRMGKACIYLLLGTAGLIFASFIITGSTAESAAMVRIAPTIISDILLPPQPPKVILPPSPPSPPPLQHAKTKLFTDPVITDEPVPEDKRMTENKDLRNVAAGAGNMDGDTASADIVPVKASGNRTGVIPIETKPAEPRRIVEQMPLFTGDLDAYISGHIHYPEQARNSMIEGRVVIEFVVNEDGSVSGTKVMRSIGGGCDEEALRMVSGMPKWKPGKQNGVPVKVFFSLSIKFELQ